MIKVFFSLEYNVLTTTYKLYYDVVPIDTKIIKKLKILIYYTSII